MDELGHARLLVDELVTVRWTGGGSPLLSRCETALRELIRLNEGRGGAGFGSPREEQFAQPTDP